MRQILRKATATLLTVMMVLALVPQDVYAIPDVATERTTKLDLTSHAVTYQSAEGVEKTADPQLDSIKDSIEGWAWYLYGDEDKDYSLNTLELSGINIETDAIYALRVPAGTTIVLVDGTINKVKSIYEGTTTTYGILCIDGDLTIKGDSGVLISEGGTSSLNSSNGIGVAQALTIDGGLITAIGGVSTSTHYAAKSVGIYANNDITINAGTIYARSDSAVTSYAIWSGVGTIIDNGMKAYQKDDESYTLPAEVLEGIYVYEDDLIPATDLKIAEIPLTSEPSFGGAGTEEEPYLISTKEDLKEMAQFVNYQNETYGDKNYLLTDDLVLNEDLNDDPELWEPIGVSQPFSGVFDGDGHTIRGLYIEGDTGYLGLFGTVAEGTVKNVGLVDGKIVSLIDYNFAGSIVGFCINGRIENCYNTGTVEGTFVGGIVGSNIGGHIQDCYNTGAITARGNYSAAGGIAGQNTNAEFTIVNCYNTGNVSVILFNDGDQGYIGGIVGQNGQASIKNCYNTGLLSSNAPENSYVFKGGIVAANLPDDNITIENVYWLDSSAETAVGMGEISGSGYISMTQTEMQAADFVNTLNSNAEALYDFYGKLSSWTTDKEENNGGYPVFVTTIDEPAPGPSFEGDGTEADPYLITTKEELKEMAQLVNEQNEIYKSKHYKLMADITLNNDINSSPEIWVPIGKDNLTPFAGVFEGGGHEITGLYMDGTASYAGLFGYINTGIVKNIGLSGSTVYAAGGNSFAGGIAAYNQRGRIEDCYNTASIGGTQSGGIVGYNKMGHIQDSYNRGGVVGIVAGGIAGANQDAAMTIVNCYNIGEISTIRTSNPAYAGGIVGRNFSGTIKNSYNAGSISAVGPGDGPVYLGGVYAENNRSTLINVYWLDSVLIEDTSFGNDNTGFAEVKNSAELKALTQTLNGNLEELALEYEDLASWKADTKDENSGYPLFDTGTTYTLTINGGGTGATTNGSYAAGTIVSINAGTREGYTFNGWTTADSITFADASNPVTTFTMPDRNATITANWRVNDVPAPGSGSGSGPKSSTPKPEDTTVIVNGRAQSAGKSETNKQADGKIVETVTVDSAKLKAILLAEKEGAKVTIPIKDGVNAGEGKLTGEMVKSMEDRSATLVIQMRSSSYTLPAAEININEISRMLGTNVSLDDITVTVKISEPENSMVKVVENAEKRNGFTLVAPAVEFTITCSYGGKSVTAGSFNYYVERMIAIPEGVNHSKITTGIVVEPSGTVYHVPTKITKIGGRYYAVINSLSNSTYSVIWNPIEFSDMTRHWAKESANNMGSRMVVTGVGNNNYDAERNMTRAEFAAIMVRALGLAPDSGKNAFSDVNAASWYSGYVKTAVSYGIIKGYDNGNFGPNDTITREQAMTMIARAMKVTSLKSDLDNKKIDQLVGAYSDSKTVSAYAKESVATCLETGITSGRGNNTIAPKSFITRAEVAVMAERLLKKSGLI